MAHHVAENGAVLVICTGLVICQRKPPKTVGHEEGMGRLGRDRYRVRACLSMLVICSELPQPLGG